MPTPTPIAPDVTSATSLPEFLRSLIHCVEEINDDILALAGGTGTSRGTGGMITKLHAAQIATEAGIDTVVMNGSDPEELYKLLDGRQTGTLFKAKR